MLESHKQMLTLDILNLVVPHNNRLIVILLWVLDLPLHTTYLMLHKMQMIPKSQT